MAGKFEKVNTFTDSSATSLTLGSIFSADYNFYNVYIRGGMTGVSDIAAERPKLKNFNSSRCRVFYRYIRLYMLLN